MPQRTNYFQQVMHHVYQQLAPTGATVTESALLRERSSGVPREVDILVEHAIASHRIQIGIECRDRSTKDDVTWVDGVIGKYSDLDIQKVILVSRSGFSDSAIRKAQAHHIECHTFSDCNNFDVRERVNALRMTFIRRSDRIRWAVITTDPKLEDGELDSSLTVYSSAGEVIGDLDKMVRMCYEPFAKAHITAHINQYMDSIFPDSPNFEHEAVFDVPIQLPQPYPYFRDPHQRAITHVLLSVACTFDGEEKPVDTYWYNDHQIAVAHITDTNKVLMIRKPNQAALRSS